MDSERGDTGETQYRVGATRDGIERRFERKIFAASGSLDKGSGFECEHWVLSDVVAISDSLIPLRTLVWRWSECFDLLSSCQYCLLVPGLYVHRSR